MRVAIIPHRKHPAGQGRLEVLPLTEAIERGWENEAGFVTYITVEEETWPRLAKPMLKPIRQAGGTVLVTCLVLDYDRHAEDGAKLPWQDDGTEAWEVMVQVEQADLPWPRWFYTTKHGLRLVYELAKPMSPEDSERAYQALLDLFEERGIPMDRATGDWTRLFFLPYIEKDGENLADLDFVFHEEFEPEPLDGHQLLADSLVKPVQHVSLDGERPDAEEADAMLAVSGSNAHTEFFKRAKKLLAKSPDAPYLFENQRPPCEPGERDDWILRFVGRVMTRLWTKIEGLTAEQCYALMRPAVALIEAGEKDPCEALWDKVQRTWEKKHEHNEIVRVSFEEKQARIVAGFEQQCRRCDVSLQALADTHSMTPFDYVRQHLIVKGGGQGVFLMQADGTYIPRRLDQSAMFNRINGMGLAEVYGLHNAEGLLRSDREVVQLRGTGISHVVGELGLHSAELRDIGKPTMHLAVPTYHLRNDLQPMFVKNVDTFLRKLAGENYERLADWIGHALDIYKPICALSIAGPPGAGKSLLGEVLGACFGPGEKNAHQVLTSDWNTGLRDNPVLHIDEGLPAGKKVDELLRVYVSGGNIPITQKRVDAVTCEIYPRLVITANDLDALRDAVSSRDLGDAAHEALATRVLHLDAHVDAADWFAAVGGRKLTENWVQGDSLAVRHFLWLHQNRNRPSDWAGGGRFLVEGDREAQEVQEFRYQTDAAQLVLKAIVEGLRNKTALVTINGNEVTTTSSAVHNYLGQGWDTKISIQKVGRVLTKLAVVGERRIPGSRIRCYSLKLDVLAQFAIEHGIDCPPLFDLIDDPAILARLAKAAE